MISIQSYKLNWKLPEPSTISFHTFYYQENVIVELRFNSEIGIGEAAPFKPITGDSQEDVSVQIKQLEQIPLDPTRDGLEKLHAFLDDKQITANTLRAAIDFAYHDLKAKLNKESVYKLYQDKAVLVPNSYTIMIKEDPKETAQDAETVYRMFPDLQILKIKLKGDDDIARAKAIKEISPAGMQFIVDANQGYDDPEKAVSALNEIASILGKVILVEEPCPKGQLDKLQYVTNHVKGMKVFADESAATVADAQSVIDHKAAHGINIKLQKAGGIWPAKQIAKMCQDNGLSCMVGCMLEGAFGIAAGIHFAVSTPVILSDLDSDLDMPVYVTKPLPFTDGQRAPLDGAGLGLSFDKQKLADLIAKNEIVYEPI